MCEVDPTDQIIVIRLHAVKAGLIRVPEMVLERVLRRAAGRVPYLKLRNDFEIKDLRLPNNLIWPNGQFPCRLREIRFEPGRVLIDVLPLPRDDAS